MGVKWTPDEDAILLVAESFEHYQRLGGTRTKGQVHNRRTNLRDLGYQVMPWMSGAKPEPRAPEPEPFVELPDPSEFEGDVVAYYEAVKAITAAKIKLVDKPSVIEWTVPDPNWTGIVFLGDIHVGGLIDYGQLEADLEYITGTDGLYAIGMGDYANRFEHSGKILHAMAGDTVPGSEDQEMLAAHVLGRCTKWLAILAGNHDDWGGADCVRRLAKSLRATYVSQAGASYKLSVGSQRYVLYLKHQYTGTSRISTSNDGRRFWTEFGIPGEHENADVTVLAHLHEPNTHQVERKGNTVSHLRGGTYKLVDPWARKGGYIPAYGPSLVLLNPHDHCVIPFHGTLWRWGVEMLTYLRGKS